MNHPNTESTPEADKPQGRRRLLQALAVGGVSAAILPEKWVKPVIDTVIVPAHAQGSIVRITGIYSNGDDIVTAPGSFMERLANFVVPSAHAQSSGPFSPGECVSFDCTQNPNVVVQYVDSNASADFAYTEIYPNNVVRDVNVANFQFFSMSASPAQIIGQVNNGGNVQSFSLPLSGQVCGFQGPV